MRFQIGKRDLVGVRFKRIFVSPYNVPIHFFIERSSGVPVNVEHVENVRQMSGVSLENDRQITLLTDTHTIYIYMTNVTIIMLKSYT